MRRDMDLIRLLLLRLEEVPKRPHSILAFGYGDPEIAIDGFERDAIAYHLELLSEAGLIENGGNELISQFAFRRLSWKGHDFLDSVRDPKLWEKTKQGASAAGGFTLDLLKDLATGFLKKQIEAKTGIKLD